MDANVHCTLGELYVTIGTDEEDEEDKKENYAWARKHFAQCLEFDKGHVRAMFGLVSATECYLEYMEKKKNASTTSKKKKKKDDEEEEEEEELVRDLRAHGVEQLFKSYDTKTNNKSNSKSAKGGTNMLELLEIVFQ